MDIFVVYLDDDSVIMVEDLYEVEVDNLMAPLDFRENVTEQVNDGKEVEYFRLPY